MGWFGTKLLLKDDVDGMKLVGCSKQCGGGGMSDLKEQIVKIEITFFCKEKREKQSNEV